jgi:hypothetical protein
MASNFVVKFGNRFLILPDWTRATVQLARLRQSSMLQTSSIIPTALDNLDASNPFLQPLSVMPIAPGVHVRSIMPVRETGPVEEGNDAVVEYKSAHTGGVESELIARSGHSTQAMPQTAEEVHRILCEYAGIH